MKPFRVSIAASLGLIAIAAVGLMGMRVGTPLWASATFCLTLAFLLAATLKATIGPAPTRPGPIGFALFGWVYLATVFGTFGHLYVPPMPHAWAVNALLERIHPGPEPEMLEVLRNPNPPPWSGNEDSFR